jgi:hypothetical protein
MFASFLKNSTGGTGWHHFVTFEAFILILENVCALQDLDPTHGMLSSTALYLAEHKMVAVCWFRIRDSATGDYSCRERVFPYFEHVDMASYLPALSPSLPLIHSRPLLQILDPTDVALKLVLPGSFFSGDSPASVGSVPPSRRASIGHLPQSF